MTNNLETFLYQLSSVFLWPALMLIIIALAYTLFSAGLFIMDAWFRRQGKKRTELSRYAEQGNHITDDLELWIVRRLELLRLTSRVTPLLGLVATLIPMGPALLALADNNTATVGQSMVVAFSGVTLALIAASLSFWILNIRRRWLFEELRVIEIEQGMPVNGAS